MYPKPPPSPHPPKGVFLPKKAYSPQKKVKLDPPISLLSRGGKKPRKIFWNSLPERSEASVGRLYKPFSWAFSRPWRIRPKRGSSLTSSRIFPPLSMIKI
jgi:hypothetical protein